MNKERINMLGNMGTYIDDNSVFTFQIGSRIKAPDTGNYFASKEGMLPHIHFLNVDGLNVAARGHNNMGCERIEHDIKRNRLFPRLISKQINFLYGKGLFPYTESMVDNKLTRVWEAQPQITEWLEIGRASCRERV